VSGRILDEYECTDTPKENEKSADTQPMSSSDGPIDDGAPGMGEDTGQFRPPTDIEQSQQFVFDSDDRLREDVEQVVLKLDLSTSASRTK